MAKTTCAVWGDGKAYFFRGDQYVRYDIEQDHADDGYPLPIASSWPGVFGDGVDAAVVWGDGKAYFFRGDEYVQYDIVGDHADDGYPQPLAQRFTGLFDGGGEPPPSAPPGDGRREAALQLISEYVPSDYGDPKFDELPKDWTGG